MGASQSGPTQATVLAHTSQGLTLKLLPGNLGNVAVIGKTVRRFDVAPHTSIVVNFAGGASFEAKNNGTTAQWIVSPDLTAKGAVVSVNIAQL